MPGKDDELLSLSQAAEIARYKPGALRTLALQGKFPARKVGKQWTITRSQLEKWMQGPDYHPGKGRPKRTS